MASTDSDRVVAGPGTNPDAAAKPKPKPKLHGRAFYESIGSPKYVVAPMVDQSEFAWRMLTRSFLTPEENSKVLAYTPMFHARLFEEAPKYRDTHFQATRPAAAAADAAPTTSPPAAAAAASSPTEEETTTTTTTNPGPFLDGNPSFDRPLFVQFCANDPAHLLGAARLAAPHCDAIDLNLGCPQGIARKGHYGAFLQEDQELVSRLIRALHEDPHLPVPVTAKIRVLDTREATLAYARTVLAAGASILTVHGRRRDQKGHLTGLADWDHIRYLRDHLPPDTVLFANGNVLQPGDLQRCLDATGADAVMAAEGNLSNPALFAPPPPPGRDGDDGREYWRPRDGADRGGWRVDAVFRRYMDILHRHALQRDPPARRPLFVVGDDEAWLHPDQENGGKEEEGEDGPARKKRKRDDAGAVVGGDGKRGKGRQEKTTSPNLLAVRPHLFHLLRHLVSRHIDIRDALARCQAGDMTAFERVLDMVERRIAEGLIEYERTGGKSVEEPELERGRKKPAEAGAAAAAEETRGKEGREQGQGQGQGQEGEDEDTLDPESSVAAVRACKRPWWVVQPIVRPLPKEALAKGSIQLSKKALKQQNKKDEVALAKDVLKNGRGGDGDELMKHGGKDGIKEPFTVVDETKQPSVPTDGLVAG